MSSTTQAVDDASTLTYQKQALASIPLGRFQGLIGPERTPLALAFSPDGMDLSIAFKKAVLVWRLEADIPASGDQWKHRITYMMSDLEQSRFTCMSWVVSGYLLVGTDSGFVILNEIDTVETRVRGFRVSELPIRSIAMEKSSTLMAITAGACEIGIWERQNPFSSWNLLRYLDFPDHHFPLTEGAQVTSLSWNDQIPGVLVASYHRYGVVVWDVRRGRVLSSIGIYSVYGYGYSAQNRGRPLITSNRPSGSLSPNGQWFAVPNVQGTFDIYDLHSQGKVTTLKDPDSPSQQPSADRPGKFIGRYWFIGAADGIVNIWDIANNRCLQRLYLDNADSQVVLLEASRGPVDRLQVAAVNENGDTIELWRALPQKGLHLVPKSLGSAVRPLTRATGSFGSSYIRELPQALSPRWVLITFLLLVLLISFLT